MNEFQASLSTLKKFGFIETDSQVENIQSINIRMIGRLARRYSWLRDRVAMMSCNGADASWDKSEMSALGWAIETLLRTLSSVEKGNSL
jgi:hypothetical protein